MRLTTAADCGGADCVTYVDYSYWRNMNNHVNSDRMLIILSLDRASVGGGTDYEKIPKGDPDLTGQYFIWTTNRGGNRLDAFIVKVPAHLLYGV